MSRGPRRWKTALLAAGLAAAASAGGAEVQPGLRVGRIAIERGSVFETSKTGESAWVFRAADALHIVTREGVIRRELLFKEGDPYDPALLAETERNLRGLGFIRFAHVLPSAPHDGVVDVEVRTADAWTTEPELSFSRTGGGNKVGAGFTEKNLLGRGKHLELSYHKGGGQGGNQETGRGFLYEDPQLLGRHIELNFLHLSLPSGFQTSGSVSRPFYSTVTPFSVSASGSYLRSDLSLFSGGADVGVYRQVQSSAGLSLGRSLGSTTRKTRRMGGGFTHSQSQFSAQSPEVAGLIPVDTRQETLAVSYSFQEVDYTKEIEVQKFDRVEDINLGLGWSAAIGVAPAALGSTESTLLPSLSLSAGWRRGAGFVLLSNTYTQWLSFGGGTSRRLGTFDIQGYYRGLPLQTLAGHAGFDYGYRLDTDNLLLGEGGGLRGYANGQFRGNRRLILSFEDRVFLVHDLLRVASIGVAAFFDSGYAWPSGSTLRLQDLKSSAGFGLRFAPSRSSTNQVVRMDMAYAFEENTQSSPWVLSVTSGYTFGF